MADHAHNLIRKISNGDQKAFEELYYMYYKQLCQFAFLILHSKELSEEVVLDIFFNLWAKRSNLSGIQNIRAYLYTAVRHQAIDYQRSQQRYPESDINAYEIEIVSPEPSVDDIIEYQQFLNLLQRAFDKLPERCRMITRMHFNDHLKYKEIAEILDISRKTVEAQITIAIRKIKEIFDTQGWNK